MFADAAASSVTPPPGRRQSRRCGWQLKVPRKFPQARTSGFSGHRIHVTDTTTIDGTVAEPEDYLAVYLNGFSGFLNNDGFEAKTVTDRGLFGEDDSNIAAICIIERFSIFFPR